MSAVLDPHTGVPDRGLQADVALEAKIDAAWNLMKRALMRAV